MSENKMFCGFGCFELQSPSMINPKLTLSSVLMKDQQDSWTATQKTTHMVDKLLAGWAILSLPQNKHLCNLVYMSN